jgi:hypothetical protein
LAWQFGVRHLGGSSVPPVIFLHVPCGT